ncbi:hypothetical protein EON67_04925, partial [archaeon]
MCVCVCVCAPVVKHGCWCYDVAVSLCVRMCVCVGVQVWDAASLTPLIDSVSTMDPALWREKVLAEQAEAAVKAAAAAAEARRKRRAEMGYDDDDEDDDLDLASNTRHEGVGVRTK